MLVMELIDGQTLAERIATGSAPVAEALAIIARSAPRSKAPTKKASCSATSSRPTSRSPAKAG
jgi:hypothetical protein